MMARPENVVIHGQHLMYWRPSLRTSCRWVATRGRPSRAGRARALTPCIYLWALARHRARSTLRAAARFRRIKGHGDLAALATALRPAAADERAA